MKASLADPEVDTDGMFRCPAKGCDKLWPSSGPQSEGYFVMGPSADGKKYMCPGCATSFASKQLLRNHYKRHRDLQHSGNLRVASPKNLLSKSDYTDYRKHMTEERKRYSKRKYDSCIIA